jgi:predicted RNA-binding protein
MCELKIIYNGKQIMEDVIRIQVEGDSIKLQSLLGDEKTVSGRIVEVNLSKQVAIIESRNEISGGT